METQRRLVPTIELTPSQERVLRLVEGVPGLTIVEAAKSLGCSHATATYHLNLLVRRGFLTGRRDGREMRHFVAGLMSDPASLLQAACRDERRLAIVLLLASLEVPITINDMSRRLAVPFGSLKRSLLQFQAQGLVEMERRGFRYVVRPQASLISYARGIARVADLQAAENPPESASPLPLLRA